MVQALSETDVKISKMSEDDRLLYENGLIDEDCKSTNTGWSFMRETIFNANKKDLVRLVKSVKVSKAAE